MQPKSVSSRCKSVSLTKGDATFIHKFCVILLCGFFDLRQMIVIIPVKIMGDM